MKTIEFFGVPGVGKSYILDTNINSLKINKNIFIRDKDFLSRIPIEDDNKFLIDYVRWFFYRVLGHPQRHLLNEYGKVFVLENQQLVKYFWSLFTHRLDGIYPLDTRMLLASHFVRTFEKIESIYYCKNYEYCYLDEGLFQRMISLYSPGFDNDEIQKYISQVCSTKYKPRAIVCCIAEDDLIISRIKGRKNRSGSHKGMSLDDIRKYTIGASIFSEKIADNLISRGLPVLKLNTSLPAHNINKLLSDFLNSI